MPITPKYYRQARLPGRLGAGYASPQAFTATERALGQLGQVIEHRGLQFKQERDSAKVVEEFSAFNEIASKKLSELLSKESGAAVGLGDDYKQWFDDALPDFLNNRLTGGNQQRVFQAKALSLMNQDLDILARHEATQHRVFRKESDAKSQAVAREQIIKEPFNIGEVDRIIKERVEEIDRLYPGHTNKAQQDAARATLYVDALEAQINIDPKTASKYLKEWREIIGPEEFSRLSGKLKSGISEQNVQTAMVAIESDYDKDKDGRLTIDELRRAKADMGKSKTYKKYGLDLSESQSVRKELQNLINTRKETEAEQIDDGSNREHRQIVERIMDSDYAGGLALLKQSYWLKNHDPAKWQALYNDLTTEPKDDPVLLDALWTLVNTQYDNLEVFDRKASIIWTGYFKSLSPKTKEHAHDQLRQLWEAAEDAPEAAAYFKIGMKVLDDKKVKYPGDTSQEKLENEFRVKTAWRKYFTTMKDRATIEEYTKKFGELTTPLMSLTLYQELMGFLGVSAGEGIIAPEMTEERRKEMLERILLETKYPGMPKPKMERPVVTIPSPLEVGEGERKRRRAIKILKENNKLINEDTIKQVMDQL